MIKVLVVDDSPDCRKLLTQILNDEVGLQVVEATGNARQAQELVARHKPHVVVMDAEMPQCDGFEAARGIMETHPVPVIILSAQQSRFSSDCEQACCGRRSSDGAQTEFADTQRVLASLPSTDSHRQSDVRGQNGQALDIAASPGSRAKRCSQRRARHARSSTRRGGYD
jgi:chemotaxis response regulator CheB